MNSPSIFYWLDIEYSNINADDTAVGFVQLTITHGFYLQYGTPGILNTQLKQKAKLTNFNLKKENTTIH